MHYMPSQARKQQFVAEFRRRLENINELPAMPEVATELLALRNDPAADIAKLVKVVSKDPGISAQIMRYSRLSLFGYGERIQTLDNAISLVLGFDKALHLAIGLAAGNCMMMQADGPLGRHNYWRHSFTTAILCQTLAHALPEQHRPSPGVAYLAGLLHDIGFLLIGHLYPDEFAMLNDLVKRYYDKDARELELLSLGISHDMVGLYLMRAWNMPEEIRVAVSEHHFPEYGGKHSVYSKLVYLANSFQHRQADHQGVMMEDHHAQAIMKELGLNEDTVQDVLRQLVEVRGEISAMVEQMAA
jgi:HD-like signal output (HDOD) protein